MVAGAPQGAPITGTNGLLDITDIRVIVEEFELEPVEVPDCDVEPEPAACEDFEARYFFIDVPLTGAPVTVVQQDIPAGLYDELEFEVDDVEVDDLRTQLRGRAMNCPGVDELITYLQHDYPSQDVKAHVASCRRCRGYRRIIHQVREAYVFRDVPISAVVIQQMLAVGRTGRRRRTEPG